MLSGRQRTQHELSIDLLLIGFRVADIAVIGPSHPIPAAHTAPPAMSVMPAMNRIVSARVSNQLLRMLRPIVGLPRVGWYRTVNE